MDVGGNTGRFALRCVAYDSEVKVTIVDLPGQIGMMQKNIAGKDGTSRIGGFPTNILDRDNKLPEGHLGCHLDESVPRLFLRRRNL